ncbi:MAG: TonB-dependent siderophore receptor [Moritella sp.]|nr:TonB-dependent siderophore receptor [Moritella sp.]
MDVLSYKGFIYMNTQVKFISAVISTILYSQASLAQAVPADSTETMIVVGYQQHYKIDQAHAAMRSDVSLLETPQMVTVIPSEVLEDQLAVTLGDALRNDASVSLGRVTSDRERFSLRGFSLEENTNILKDGHQHFAKYRMPMALIDNVEVLKGPSSLLYGQSAPGGIVNLVTKKPSNESSVKFAVKGDDHGSFRNSIDATGSLNDNKTIRYRAIIEQQNNNSWREYQDGSNLESESVVGSLVTEFDVTDALTIALHYDKLDDVSGQDSGALVDDNGNVIGGDSTIWDMPWTKIDAQSENYGVDVTYQVNSYWQVATGYNNQHNERERWESKPQTGKYDPLDGSYGNKPYNKLEDWQQQSFYFDLMGSVTTGSINHELLVGGNYLAHEYTSLKVKDKEKLDGNINDGTIIEQPVLDYADPKAESKSEDYKYYGVYVQDLVTLNDQWQVLAGVRYDRQDKTDANNNAILPKFGVIYHPQDNASIYANYSESFEPLGRVLDDGPSGNNGMELDPVKGKMYELGTKWQVMDNKLAINAAIFDITRSNIKLTKDADDGDGDVTTQGGEQHHQGVELSAIGKVSSNLSLITSVMYLDAKYAKHNELEGNRPEDVPEWTASIWSKYVFTEQLSVNLGAYYEGERYGDEDNKFLKDSYIRIDTGINYQTSVAGNALQLRLNIDNLFDTDYLAGGENGEVNVGEPRTFKFGISYTL